MAERDSGRHEPYLDCVRGYAIMLVIAAHAVYLFPGVPYPLKRLATIGWSGVQLFFIASMVTLLMSWNAERKRTGTNDLRRFALRRLFRIAPMYYAGALLYLATSPPTAVDASTVAANILFVNAWDIDWLTGQRAWSMVPGGWSISVEMSFYALFPAYATTVRSTRAAAVALAASLAIGLAANVAAAAWLAEGAHQPRAVGLFLFYWLPNQLTAFAIGGLAYRLLPKVPRNYDARQRGHLYAAGALAALAATTFAPSAMYMGAGWNLSTAQIAAVPLAAFLMAMSMEPRWFTNRAAKAIGKVSFSAYVLHMAVLRGIGALPGIFDERSTGIEAAAAYAATLGIAIATTAAISLVAWATIERTGIALGRRLTARLSTAPQGRAKRADEVAPRKGRGRQAKPATDRV